MSQPRADLVVSGEVLVEARPEGIQTAEAIGIGGGRVLVAGRLDDVLAAAIPGARRIEAGRVAVVPGLHDGHIHLAGLARHRSEVTLDDAGDVDEIARRLAAAAARVGDEAWVLGRGWTERAIERGLGPLHSAVAGRLVWISSHDGHSAWVSGAALDRAGIDASTPDPPGGRIERGGDGRPNGILRETARDLVEPFVVRARGAALRPGLDATLAELAALGITGATDMAAYTTTKGEGRYARFGDDFSAIAELADVVEGRLRLWIGFPAAALLEGGVEEIGQRSGDLLPGSTTIRLGWAKAYLDGALGSRTAALFEPHSCGDIPDAGILRLEPSTLVALFAAARQQGIGLAVHAIGDRAAAAFLEAADSAGRPSALDARVAPLPDRIEHAQLVRAADRERIGKLGILASMQPIHAPSDRHLVEACWAGRVADAYATRSIGAAGATLIFGSDAPVEPVNPWHGLLAAVRRRLPGEPDPGWRIEEAIEPTAALAAYTSAAGLVCRDDALGHLRPGAYADLAVLDIGLDMVLAAGDEAAGARSVLTLVGGREVHRS
jgi:predicted amidohydrolase YtcJ